MRHYLLAIISFFCMYFPCDTSGHAAAAQSDDNALLLMVSATTANPRPSAQGVIGPGGGTVASGQVSVAAPAGAFGADTAVRLAGQRTKPDFVGYPDSLVWTAAVDAQGWSQPLSLCLGQVGGPDRELPVALADALVVDSDRAEQRPGIVAGQVRNGRLCVELGPNDGASFDAPRAAGRIDRPADVPTRREVTFWKISGFETLRSDHFRLYYPAKIAAYPEDIPQQILNFAEKAYAKLAAMGFETTGLTLPLSITVQGGMGQTDGEAGVPLSGKGGQYINLNADICAPDFLERLQVTIGHEYFHVIQNLYNPRSALAIRHPWAAADYLLLSEASSVWFEGHMLDSGSYVSEVFTQNIAEHQTGLGATAERGGLQSRGYWASGFLRYLRDAQGSDNFVYDLWAEIHASGSGLGVTSDISALTDVWGSLSDFSAKWAAFYEKAAAGTAYASWPKLPSSQTHYVKTPTGGYLPYADFRDDITPLSGRIWRVSVNALESGDSNWAALAEGDSDLSFVLFKTGSGGGGTYSRLGAITPGTALRFTANQGDMLMVAVNNSNNSYPYRTASTAILHLRTQSDPLYCPDVPHGWPMEFNNGVRWWRHATQNYVVAEENYFSGDPDQPATVLCMDIGTGQYNLRQEWYENGKQKFYSQLEGDHAVGLQKLWFENGQLHEQYYRNISGGYYGSYVDYLESGTLRSSGNYCDDGSGKIGEWYFYGDGYPYTCTYAVCNDQNPKCENVSGDAGATSRRAANKP